MRVQAKFFFEGDRKFFVKGVTYGPFAPDDQGDHFGTPERARRDLAMMRDAGINLVRVYYVPPAWFMDACADHGIRFPPVGLSRPGYRSPGPSTSNSSTAGPLAAPSKKR